MKEEHLVTNFVWPLEECVGWNTWHHGGIALLQGATKTIKHIAMIVFNFVYIQSSNAYISTCNKKFVYSAFVVYLTLWFWLVSATNTWFNVALWLEDPIASICPWNLNSLKGTHKFAFNGLQTYDFFSCYLFIYLFFALYFMFSLLFIFNLFFAIYFLSFLCYLFFTFSLLFIFYLFFAIYFYPLLIFINLEHCYFYNSRE